MRMLASVVTVALTLLFAPLQLTADDAYIFDFNEAGYVDQESGLVWAGFEIIGFTRILNYDYISSVLAAEDYADAIVDIPFYGPLSADPDPVTDLFTLTNHRLMDNQTVRLDSSGTLPDGLEEDVDYYAIVVDADTFRLSATFDGSPIDFSGTGTGDLGQWIDYAISFETEHEVASQYEWRLPTVAEMTDAYQKGLFDAEGGYLIRPEIWRWTIDTKGAKGYQFNPTTGQVRLVPKTYSGVPIAVRADTGTPPSGGGGGNGHGNGKNK